MRNGLFTSFDAWFKGICVCLLTMLALSANARAQTQITTGTIQGTVSDANGAVLPGANVEIKNLDTNLSRNLSTDEGGRFVALAMSPGRYSITVSKTGFATAVAESVELTVGQALNLPVSMKIFISPIPFVSQTLPSHTILYQQTACGAWALKRSTERSAEFRHRSHYRQLRAFIDLSPPISSQPKLL